jgi:hypothetical protein
MFADSFATISKIKREIACACRFAAKTATRVADLLSKNNRD